MKRFAADMKICILYTALAVAGPVMADEPVGIIATGGETIEKTGAVSCTSVGIGEGGGNVVFDAATVAASGTLTFTKGVTGAVSFLNGTQAEFAGRTFFATGEDKDTHAIIRVVDSSLQPANSSGCEIGNNTAGSTCTVALTNSTFTSAVVVQFYAATEVSCSNSTILLGKDAKFGSSKGAGLSGSLEMAGSSLTVTGNLFVGFGSEYDVLVSGGAFNANYLYVSGYKDNGSVGDHPSSTLRFSNGAVASATLAYIADVTNGTAKVVIDSGAVLSVSRPTSATSFYLGRYGEAVIEINDGGTLEAWCVTGGTAQEGGSSAIKVNGGTFRVAGYRGGSTGTNEPEIFKNIGSITVGEKGFVIDTDRWPVTITQSITGGPVIFAGGGTVTITSGVTIDEIDIRDGTTVLWEDQGDTETVSVTAPGVQTRTEAVVRAVNSTTVFDIASGAGLTLKGDFVAGAVEKRGGGILKFDTPTVKPLGALTLSAGTIGFGESAPNRLHMPFTLGNQTDQTLTVIFNEADLTMPFPVAAATKGAFLKRGAGELVWERDASWAILFSGMTAPVAALGLDPSSPLDFGDGTVLPTGNFAHINVAEGRFTIRGTTSGRNAFRLVKEWVVGGPVTECSVQPGLAFENIDIMVTQVDVGISLPPGSPVTAPKFVLDNAYLRGIIRIARNMPGCDPIRPSVHANNSTVECSMICLNGGGQYEGDNHNVIASHLYENGSRLMLNVRLEYQNPATVVFDASTLCGATENDAVTIYSQYSCCTNTTVFRNGSRFCFAGSLTTPSAAVHCTRRQTFVFDDSVMDPCTADDFVYDVDTAHFNMYFGTCGKGLVLTPAAGQTITMAEPINGDGGFVNRGEGTSVLADGVVCYSGVTRAESGSVSFANQTLTALKLAGPGAFREGVLVDPVLSLSVDGLSVVDPPALDLAGGLSLSGRVTVDLGVTKEEPLAETEDGFPVLTVAAYTGQQAPDVSNWRLKRGMGLRGSFKAADGVVTCVPESSRGSVVVVF